MPGLASLFGVAILFDAWAIKRKRETISAACLRTQTTPFGAWSFRLFWAVLSVHLLRRKR